MEGRDGRVESSGTGADRKPAGISASVRVDHPQGETPTTRCDRLHARPPVSAVPRSATARYRPGLHRQTQNVYTPSRYRESSAPLALNTHLRMLRLSQIPETCAIRINMRIGAFPHSPATTTQNTAIQQVTAFTLQDALHRLPKKDWLPWRLFASTR